MRYTINLDCKTHYVRKDGTIPLLLRVSINGEHDYINIGKKIKISQYDTENKCVKSGITGYSTLTSYIDRQKIKIDTIISDHEKRGDVLSVQRLKEIFEQETGKVKSISFYDFVEETIKRERELNEISSDTLDNYDTYSANLKKYSPKLSIHDINKKFLEEYKSHIKETLKQSDNTAYHAMCFLRKYTKILFNTGKIGKYPFIDFIVGKPFEVEPEYLLPEELTKLHELYNSKELLKVIKKAKSKHAQDFNIGEQYQKILRYYLASCYCGLRHSDIKTLHLTDIQGNFIVKELQKGRLSRKKTVRIPIRKKLLSLLEIKSKSGLAFENPVMETAQTNKYLKDIMKIAGINKHITFHSARHTFAIISLLLGIKIEVVSDILGHSELTTTQRYARVIDRLREQEMNKWDNMANEEFGGTETIVNCPTCENMVLKFEKNVIRLNKLPLVCPYCSTSFLYNLKENAPQFKELTTQLKNAS
jgi:integrase